MILKDNISVKSIWCSPGALWLWVKTFCKLFFFYHAWEEHRSEENSFKKRVTFFLLSLRSALECMISGKFLKSCECMTFLLSLRSALEYVIWGKFLMSWECAGSAWFLQLSLRSALGVRDFRKMLEVLEVHSALLLRWWKCIKSVWKCVGVCLPMTGVREKCALQRTSVQQGQPQQSGIHWG